MRWQLQVGKFCVPIDIRLLVDCVSYSVRVTSNGQVVFPTQSDNVMSILEADLCCNWKLSHGVWTFVGIGDSAYHCSDDLCGAEARLIDDTATDAGTGSSGTEDATFSDDARTLRLEVPWQNPMQALLCADSRHLVTHYFVRPLDYNGRSCQVTTSTIVLQLWQDAGSSRVTSIVGCDTFSHFLSGEARKVGQTSVGLKHSWRIQLGPFTEHKVTVSKADLSSDFVTLTVDGRKCVEASAADLDCGGDTWDCNFRFSGTQTVEFEVLDSMDPGLPLPQNSKRPLRQQWCVSHVCRIQWACEPGALPRLWVDGILFESLKPMLAGEDSEASLDMDLASFGRAYGINMPNRIATPRLCKLAHLPSMPRRNHEAGLSLPLAFCCGTSSDRINRHIKL
jgi:hypothetical protein